MKVLAAELEKLGARSVVTYLQSGNAVAEVGASLLPTIAKSLSTSIHARLGFAPAVVVRSTQQVASVARAHPLGRRGDDPEEVNRRLAVMFLAGKPSAVAGRALDPGRSPGDEFLLRGSELFLRYSTGAGTTRLTPDYLERALGVLGTARNWNTVQALREMMTPG